MSDDIENAPERPTAGSQTSPDANPDRMPTTDSEPPVPTFTADEIRQIIEGTLTVPDTVYREAMRQHDALDAMRRVMEVYEGAPEVMAANGNITRARNSDGTYTYIWTVREGGKLTDESYAELDAILADANRQVENDCRHRVIGLHGICTACGNYVDATQRHEEV